MGEARAAPLAWIIAWRFLSGAKSRLLDGTARAALLATALGVAAMVIAMALMTGYSEDLQAKLVGDNAAVGAYPLGKGAEPLSRQALAALAAIPGVTRVGRVAYGEGLLASEATEQGVEVTLRGVEPGAASHARPDQLLPGEDGLPGAVLGHELARTLGVATGDVVRLTALGFAQGRPRFRYQTLAVRGTFASGFSEFDSAWAEVERGLVERLTGREGTTALYELRLADPARAAEVAGEAEAILGPDYLVTDWRHLNRELFSALLLQKRWLFIVLGLVVAVSTFNVASTLVVMVRERMRDIGALAAMGLAPRRLAAVFVLCGCLLGGLGTLAGIAVGSLVAWVLTTFRLIRFGAEVAAIYFIDAVPFRVEVGDLLAIAGWSLLLTLAACLFPALHAARVEPSRALRYE